MSVDSRDNVARESEHPYPQRVPDVARRAIEAALATTTDDRAWALVRLAADLRALGELETAFVALDAAWGLGPSLDPSRAMFSCAIACHCDSAAYDVGHLVASEQPEEFHDLKFSRAAVRLYSTLLEETGEERWMIERDHYGRHIDELGE